MSLHYPFGIFSDRELIALLTISNPHCAIESLKLKKAILLNLDLSLRVIPGLPNLVTILLLSAESFAL